MIKLVQLPIPEVHDLFNTGNIPLAAGYLKAYAVYSRAAHESEIDIVPRHVVNYGGDAAILKFIQAHGAPVSAVGFTCYMWNVERDIHLATQLKEQNPGVKIIFGGPEMAGIHPLVEAAGETVDVIIQGEGEEAFSTLLTDLKNHHRLHRFYKSNTALNLEHLPNPYLEKMLVPEKGEAMYIETMRGCPYPCKYCFYSKSFPGLRFQPGNQLPRLFEMAREYGVREIYIMDPSFNVTPGLKKRLAVMAGLNSSKIAMHTEIRLESVTAELSHLMASAGFVSVEAGLQSINPPSLSAIGRTWNRERFKRGAWLLTEKGIDVKTGVILGLPEDSLVEFEHTLDFVSQLGLEEFMEIYLLSMLPGTLLRDEAASLGIDYMPFPPYWVTRNRYMQENDFKYAVEMIENKLGIEFFHPVIPRFKNVYPGLIHFLDLRRQQPGKGHLDEIYRHPEQVGHSLSIILDDFFPEDELTRLGKFLQQTNRYTLIQLVFDTATPPQKNWLKQLSNDFFHPGHYFNRIHHYKLDAQGMYSLRFFHLTADLEIARRYIFEPLFCDLIVKYSPALLKYGGDILEEKPLVLVKEPVSQDEWEKLTRIYYGFENFCLRFT